MYDSALCVFFFMQVRIINLSSTNQTLVNGKPITEVEVKHLDVFTISDRSFRFEFASPVLKKGKDKSPKVMLAYCCYVSGSVVAFKFILFYLFINFAMQQKSK